MKSQPFREVYQSFLLDLVSRFSALFPISAFEVQVAMKCLQFAPEASAPASGPQQMTKTAKVAH